MQIMVALFTLFRSAKSSAPAKGYGFMFDPQMSQSLVQWWTVMRAMASLTVASHQRPTVGKNAKPGPPWCHTVTRRHQRTTLMRKANIKLKAKSKKHTVFSQVMFLINLS